MDTRRGKILQILLNTNIWINGSTLADIFKVSNRTIRNDIREINQTIQEFDVKIESDTKQGYFIHNEDRKLLSTHLDELLSKQEDFPQTPEERENYILYRLVFEDDFIATETIGSELYVSKGTAYLDIKRLEKTIDTTSSCKLLIDSGVGVKLEGSEASKRLLLSNSIRTSNKYDLSFDCSFYYERKTEPQKAEDCLISIYEMLINELNRHECSMVDKDMISFSKELYISLLRIQNGNNIVESESNEILLTNFINDLCTSIEYRMNVVINQKERMFIQACFNSKRLLTTSNEFVLGTSKEDDIYKQFIQSVNDEYSLNLSSSESFEKNLKTHLSPMVSRIQTNQMEHSSVAEQIKKKYPFAYVISTKIIPIIYEHTAVIISETELSYIALHVAVALDDIFIKKNILVVCGSGFATARLIKKELNSRLSPYVNQINIISYLEYENLEVSNIKEEIIVSSVPIKNTSDKIPVVIVNPILTIQDIKNVEKVVVGLNESMKNKVNELEKFFPRELYMLTETPNTYLSLVYDMVKNLSKFKYIDNPELFYASVIERETIFSTVLDNGIGIPHPMKSMSRNSVVSVAVIPDGLNVGDKTVYIVLLFSVNSKELDKLSVLYEYLEYFAESNYTRPLPEDLLDYDKMIDYLAKKGDRK